MYAIDTDIINGYDNGQQITEEAYKMLLNKGCPEEWFIKREFEVGDWVILKRSWETSMNSMGDIGRITEIKREAKFLGDIKPGAQINEGESGWEPIDYLHPATPEEIKEHLTEEANKRGLESGEGVSSLETGRHNLSGLDHHHNEKGCHVRESSKIGGTIEYDAEKDILWACGWGVVIIYKQGNWAEPIDTTPDIEINGYKAGFHDEYVQFGCAKIDKKFFTEMYIHNTDAWDYTGEGNRSVTGIRWGDGTFTLDQIKQIAKYYQ